MTDLPAIDALWDYEHPRRSERVFLDLRAGLPREAPPAYRAELLTQIARAQALQRRFDDADRTLDEAEAIQGGAAGRARVRAVSGDRRYKRLPAGAGAGPSLARRRDRQGRRLPVLRHQRQHHRTDRMAGADGRDRRGKHLAHGEGQLAEIEHLLVHR